MNDEEIVLLKCSCPTVWDREVRERTHYNDCVFKKLKLAREDEKRKFCRGCPDCGTKDCVGYERVDRQAKEIQNLRDALKEIAEDEGGEEDGWRSFYFLKEIAKKALSESEVKE